MSLLIVDGLWLNKTFLSFYPFNGENSPSWDSDRDGGYLVTKLNVIRHQTESRDPRAEKARLQEIRHATRAEASSSMYIIPKTLFYLFKVVTFPGQHISRRLLPLRRAVVTVHTVCNNVCSIKGTCTFSFTSPQRIKTQTVRSVEL